MIGGWGGIRTLETLARLPVFKTGAFNHSATHPGDVGFDHKTSRTNAAPLVADAARFVCRPSMARVHPVRVGTAKLIAALCPCFRPFHVLQHSSMSGKPDPYGRDARRPYHIPLRGWWQVVQ